MSRDPRQTGYRGLPGQEVLTIRQNNKIVRLDINRNVPRPETNQLKRTSGRKPECPETRDTPVTAELPGQEVFTTTEASGLSNRFQDRRTSFHP